MPHGNSIQPSTSILPPRQPWRDGLWHRLLSVAAGPLPWILLAAAAWRALLLAGAPPVQLTPDGIRHLRAAFALFPAQYATWFQAWITPGYATFLWALFKIAGTGPWQLALAQSALGLFSVAVYYKLAKRCAGRLAGVVVGSYLALHPVVLALEHCVLTETLALLLQGLALSGAVRVLGEPGRKAARLSLFVGAVTGAAAVVRPNLVVTSMAVVGAGIWLAVARRFRPAPLSAWATAWRTLAMSAIATSVMAPWLLNNAVAHRKYGGLSGVANTSRIVFALEAGFLRADDPELVALYPDLPAKCETEHECGWHVIEAVRSRTTTEYDIDDWAARVMSRAVETRPNDFVRAAVRLVARQMAFDGTDGLRDVDAFVRLTNDRDLYTASMNRYLVANPDLRPMVVQHWASSRRAVAWLYEHIWRQRFPFLFGAFVVLLPWCAFRRGMEVVTLAAAASIAALVLILAYAGRYVLLVEPLMAIVVVAGARAVAEQCRGIALRVGRHGRAAIVVGSVALTAALAPLAGIAPRLAPLVAEWYHIETTAVLGARRLTLAGGPAEMRRLALSSRDTCSRARARLALLAVGVDSVGGIRTSLSAWYAGCPRLTERNLLASKDSEWHGPYPGGAVALLTQAVRLEPDSLYVYEAWVKSTAPLVPLYWQVEIGRHLDPVRGLAQWTHVVNVFMTPHWDGAARTGWFSPVLALGHGDLWLRGGGLYHVPIPDPSGSTDGRRDSQD